MSTVSFKNICTVLGVEGQLIFIEQDRLKDSSHPLSPNGTQSIKSDRTRKYL